MRSHHILIFLTGQEEIEAFAKSARTIAKVCTVQLFDYCDETIFFKIFQLYLGSARQVC